MYASACTMQTFTGICHASDLRPVAGRIVFRKEAALLSNGTRFVVVHSPIDHSIELEENLAGIICVGDCSFSDPPVMSCPVFYVSAFPCDCEGKIALLEPARGILYVSPDIGVCNRLFPHLSLPFPILPSGNRLRIGSVLSYDTPSSYPPAESLLLLPDLTVSEEDVLYERYRDLAENAFDIPITVMLSYSPKEMDEGRFLQQIRALFRGAVFGRFSLLIRGILTDTDWNVCREAFRKAENELTREMREHNGYIPKGILLDTPLLLNLDSLSDVDFQCLELDRLWDLQTGYSSHKDRKAESLFLKTLLDSAAQKSNLPSLILCYSSDWLTLLPKLCEGWRVTDCLVPPFLSARVRERFVMSGE